MSEMVRTFIAVEIRDTDTLRRLVAARDQLMATGADLKPVEDENIHLTVRFIGEIPTGLVKTLCDEISKIEFQRFQMHVKGLGAFPSVIKPRVVWAGVVEGKDQLERLHEVVETIVRRLGIPPDREKFVPHITLARVKGYRGIEKLSRVLIDLQDFDFGTTEVDELVVKKSILTPRGPIYTNLCSKKFA